MPAAIFRALLIGVLAATCGFASIGLAFGKKGPQQAAEEAAKRRPMAFFLAKGAADACGEGCREWIAAEGVFDGESAKRFLAFLAGLNRYDLPVFFHSPGGSVSQSVLIGNVLRQHRMRVGVGRTSPNDCTRGMSGDACHRLMRTGRDRAARLIVVGANCYSACAYAFLGGSTRAIGKGARLGVHSAFPGSSTQGRMDSEKLVGKTHELLRRYAIEMGIDSALIDLAARTESTRMHPLTKDEIERFGVETVAYFETGWLSYQRGDKAFGLMKSLTQQETGDKNPHSAVVQLECANSFGLLLRYRRELQPGQAFRPVVRLNLGGRSMPLGSGIEQSGFGFWATVAPAQLMEQAAARGMIDIVESYAPGAKRDPQTFTVSTNGLPEALTGLQKHCVEQRQAAGRS